jgi:hypothetical protein
LFETTSRHGALLPLEKAGARDGVLITDKSHRSGCDNPQRGSLGLGS